ncbi:MAG: 4-(cytidine 5'-diphospho)-2-C-methyl-D-erythritol kinase [Actinomycetota bacterium]|nr:4-(cytidine 5'-diphospho)-2-C-methyl-D-erythritol kinase [Actinomycetota bacterium]
MIAGAKINLSLRVGALRADGYHEVATVLAALALGDSLELEPAAATRVEAPALAGGDSLVTRALGLLAARTGHEAGWRVHIDKCVPVGAGLGGGSADAAAALRLANATLPEPLALRDLTALAAEVGSDVPFFVSGHETALARGRGELLEPCPVRAAAWVVTAWPGVALGTAEVYARYRPPAGARERVAALAAEPFATEDVEQLAALIENDLGAPAAELCPPVLALRARLLASGALAAAMSGSGSAVFGLFADEYSARSADERLRGSAPWIAVSRLTQTGGGARITA